MCQYCDSPVYAKKMCRLHYMRMYKTGRPDLGPGNKQDLWLRILTNIRVEPNGCWTWTGQLSTYGYSKIKIDGKTMSVSRFLWFLCNGPLESSETLDHLCHTNDRECPGGVACNHRACVNPLHLDPCSGIENTRRRDVRRIPNQLCNKGIHRLEGNNLKIWISPSGEVKRRCRNCQSEYRREYERRRRNGDASDVSGRRS